jgi:hypothetical protein
MYVYRNNKAHSCYSGKAINTRSTYSCVRVRVHACGCTGACACAHVPLLTQHEKRMRGIMSYLACLVLPYFPTLSHKQHYLRGKQVPEHSVCVSIFPAILFETFLILKRIMRDIVTNVKASSCKVPVILLDFNET